MTKARLILATLIASGLLAGAAFAVASETRTQPPTAPPYRTDSGGRIDPASLPERVPVVDSQGRITGYIDRSELLDGPGPLVGPRPADDPLLHSVEVVPS